MKHLGISTFRRPQLLLAALCLVALGLTRALPVSAAACTPPAADYGTVTSPVTIPASGTYRVWSRIQVPDTTNNTFLLEIDGNCVGTVGGSSSIPTNTWYWVSGQSQTNYLSATITAGSHSVKMIGNKPGVSLDRIIFTQDTTSSYCLPPTGTGDDCASPPDTQGPTVSITSPTAGASVAAGTTVAVSASASDDSGTVSKVEFYVDGTLKSTDTTSPYTYSWNTAGLSGSHTVSAKAYDPSNNIGSASAITVNITTAGKSGDVNGDQLINGFDLSIILSHWNQTGATRSTGDVSSDGTVNGFDLSIVLSNWGK